MGGEGHFQPRTPRLTRAPPPPHAEWTGRTADVTYGKHLGDGLHRLPVLPNTDVDATLDALRADPGGGWWGGERGQPTCAYGLECRAPSRRRSNPSSAPTRSLPSPTPLPPADVEYAVPDYVLYAARTPDDPLYSRQWGLPRVGARAAWNVAVGGGRNGSAPPIVCIIDSGVDYK